MADINTGTIKNPYRQFTETIPAGQTKNIYYDANNFAILYTSSQNLSIDFGGSGGATPIWQGMKYKSEVILPYVQLFNRDTLNSLTVTICMGIGDIEDNRMSVAGAIEVQNYANGSLNVNTKVFKLLDVTEYTIGAGETSVTLDPDGATFTRIQNTGTNDLRLYAADGFILPAQSIEELTLDTPFTVHGVANDTLVFGRFK